VDIFLGANVANVAWEMLGKPKSLKSKSRRAREWGANWSGGRAPRTEATHLASFIVFRQGVLLGAVNAPQSVDRLAVRCNRASTEGAKGAVHTPERAEPEAMGRGAAVAAEERAKVCDREGTRDVNMGDAPRELRCEVYAA